MLLKDAAWRLSRALPLVRSSAMITLPCTAAADATHALDHQEQASGEDNA